MANTDLFVRSKAKAQVTDLWLHPAGADGGAPSDPFDSGTVNATASTTGTEWVADAGTSTTTAAFASAAGFADGGALTATATPAGLEALADTGGFAAAASFAGIGGTPSRGGDYTVAINYLFGD